MNIKLLFLPLHSTNASGGEDSFPVIPPLGISTLKGYLSKHNIDVDLDDLSIKVTRKNLSSLNDKINLDLFDNEKKVKMLLSGNDCPELVGEGKKMLELTDIEGYDIIGLSVMNSNNFSSVSVPIVLSKLIKMNEGSTVIVGGNIRAGVDEKILRSGYVDYRIIGDSRTSLGEINLLKFLRRGEGEEPKEIDGVSYIEGGKHKYKHRKYTREEKSIITSPDFEGLPLEAYKEVIENKTGDKFLVLPYFSMRGCPFNCAHCSQSRDENFNLKGRAKAIREIKELSKKYNTDYFLLLDSEILKPEKFAREIINQGLEIKYTAPADFRTISTDSLETLKKSGAERLIFGVENGSQRMRKYLNKDFDTKEAEKILKKSTDLGINTIITIICGFPWERKADVKGTYQFLKDNCESIDSAFINKFFLDGKFLDSPEEMGVKLIETKGPLGTETLKFEEMGGRNWPSIKKFRKYSYETIQGVIERYFGFPRSSEELFSEKTT